MKVGNIIIFALAIGLTSFLLPSWVLYILLILISLFTAFFGVFETVGTGRMKFVIRGEEYVRTVKSYHFKFLLWRNFGLHFIGWKFFNYGVKTFEVNTDKENPNPEKNKIETLRLSGERRLVDYLLEEIPRILIITNVELGGDTLQADLGVPIVLTVSDDRQGGLLDGGARFVFLYNADFTLPEAIIKAAVIKKVAEKCKTYKELVEAPTSLLNELMYDPILTQDLLKFGFKLTLIKIDNIATDKSIEEVARKKTLALAEREVTLIEKGAEADGILLVSKAKAQGLTLEEIAKSQPLIDLINNAYPGATQEQRLKLVTELLGKKALGDSNITTLITDLFK